LAYRRLLDTYYTEERPLPCDPEQCARLIALRDHTKEVQAVLSEFFDLRDDGWHNDRCDLEISRYHARVDIARTNGKSGGRPKKTQSEPSGNQDGNQTETGSKANQEPRTINQEKKTPRVADLLAGVDEKVITAFVAMRKSLRAPITELAVDGIKREASKAGITLEQALTMCCERSWRGFKAEWVKDKPATNFDWDAEELRGAV
jgi:uncharacterized protein YdaU (DUF1376 family)